MILNLRGRLGNQIILIAYAMSQAKVPCINTNAVSLRKQLKDMPNVRFIDSLTINYFFGVLRKAASLIKGKPVDIKVGGFYDGYFQYGNITNIIPAGLIEHIKEKIVFDSNIENVDVVLHIRGADYFLSKSERIYEICDADYYMRGLNLALRLINKNMPDVFVVTNDGNYSSKIIERIKTVYHGRINFVVYSKNEWDDFSLIYRANIAIISNSTFSMAARLLDKKTTIAPRQWFTKASKLNSPYANNFTYLDNK